MPESDERRADRGARRGEFVDVEDRSGRMERSSDMEVRPDTVLEEDG